MCGLIGRRFHQRAPALLGHFRMPLPNPSADNVNSSTAVSKPTGFRSSFPARPIANNHLARHRLLSRKSASMPLPCGDNSLLKNCYKAKRLQRNNESGGTVELVLRPIHHRKDRLAGFPAVVCDPKLPFAKGSSRPKAAARICTRIKRRFKSAKFS